MPSETRPSPLSKIGENACGAYFLQLCRKKEYGELHILFHDFNKTSASFQWEKNWQESMLSFLTILLNNLCELSYNGSSSACQN